MKYKPTPIDTSNVVLSEHLVEIREILAKNAHDNWAANRMNDGWTHGPRRNDKKKKHPCLVPYHELPEAEKEYDRIAAMQTLLALLALGYRIETPNGGTCRLPEAAFDELYLCQLSRLRSDEKLYLNELVRIWEARLPEWRQGAPELHQRLADRMLKQGHPLMAYDVLAEALQNPTWKENIRLNQLFALALARSGATHRAHEILLGLKEAGHDDSETMGMLARTYKDLASTGPDRQVRRNALTQSHEIYNDAFTRAVATQDLDGAVYNGINAAATAFLSERRETAADLAGQVRRICHQKLDAATDYWTLATLGEAQLMLGDLSRAEERYTQAAKLNNGDYGDLCTTRKQARLLLEHNGLDRQRLDHCFKIPRVVVFSGHMIDQPGRKTRRFPQELVPAVSRAIAARLRKLEAGIGYSSAACGADILFLEGMLRRKAELHTVLPFAMADFRKASVDIIPEAGWGKRFDRVMQKIPSKLIASDHRRTGSAVAYEYANLVLDGLARLHARWLDTELVPLVVWDGKSGDGPGGTASLVGHWRKRGGRLEIIDINKLNPTRRRVKSIPSLPSPRPATEDYLAARRHGFPQKIVAMLFFDVVGYSKLLEEQIPGFVKHFMGAVDKVVKASSFKPLQKNTWGDALYCVFSSAQHAGTFALRLRDEIARIDWESKGLPPDLNLRISLHAGPVYLCKDPVLNTRNFTGSQVSRAARIEPVTPPGQVYASQQFAALCEAKRIAAISCEYVGQTTLPKSSGIVPLYLVQWPY